MIRPIFFFYYFTYYFYFFVCHFYQEELSYEKAVMDIICKRKQGTSVCKDVLEKTLAIEKKTLVLLYFILVYAASMIYFVLDGN